MPSKGDIKFGQLAVEMEYVSKDKIEDALRLQAQLEKQGKITSVDRILLKKGILDAEQIAEIEKKQGRRVVFCPECSNKLNVAIFGPGTRIRCPKCDTSLTVPSGVKYEVVDRKDAPAKPAKAADKATGETIKVKKPAAPAPKKKKDEDEIEDVDLLGDDDEPKTKKQADDDLMGGDDLADLGDDVEVLDDGGADDDDDLDGDDDSMDLKDDDDLEIIEDDDLGPKPPKSKGPDKKKPTAPEKPPTRPGSRLDKFKKK